ncbi:MAG: bifunctional demethylmenaquinone methyltransferase/2-methoxy-6-polyprenyl-1,4-benzoquinol methylase [Geobacteraceae bacterium GWC2_55_20]|nr:MAG: bifunctional demethylmenaquinone methyltransferase/2-methoxy-6-polyprenyl-1,4-benzoquinol methylase [Geobacteraceae bacterium GWC2_55_20]OGU26657.1 MAG: bifunctional demethylmenaquinone methyltransferase/2-methoxy-6-polyprenyl-1,4-benzoquinol methylase [Geobacteraceae bacterium GWF2_54_21]HBA73255.1 bifunctional demethylmenaquinone methyltransferase/2-methoxy-6-polyprenyl-1,4-benzoquinol methylase UbiE [Geobacter sp.]HCE68693.1 bifunctional demethylmenaquinone methyltransferase/2-methoxy
MFRLSDKGEKIQQMFGAIAPKYDFLNRLLSFGIDRRWRKKAVRLLKYREGSRILDVATGTGDVALEIARSTPASVRITGADFCREMVELGEVKVAASPYASRIDLKVAPCEDLPFANDTFDSITIAFGIRNVVDRKLGLAEMWRVLRPGGRMIILEFSTPKSQLFRQIYYFYFRRLLPIVGGLFSRYNAYKYLPDSVLEFPSHEEFSRMISEAGFRNLHIHELTFGIATIYAGEKE